MPTITAGPYGLNMNTLNVQNLLTYTYYEAYSTSLRLFDNGSNYILFQGSSFAYSNVGAVIGGTITSIQEVRGGVTDYTVTGLSFSAAAFYNFVLNGNNEAAFTQILAGNDRFNGSEYADYLFAYAGNDEILAGGGDDIVRGGLGSDTILGGAGNDTLNANADEWWDNVADTLNGGDGNDALYGAREDTFIGGGGVDQVSINFGDLATIDLRSLSVVGGVMSGALPGGGFVSGVEEIVVYRYDYTTNAIVLTPLTFYGSEGADKVISYYGGYLEGNGGNDHLIGSGTLMGGAGNDILQAGDLGSVLDGGTGIDVMYGSPGDDTFVIDNASEANSVYSFGGIDTILTSLSSFALASDFTNLVFTGNASVIGLGNARDNIITGAGVLDQIDGAGGIDIFRMNYSASSSATSAGTVGVTSGVTTVALLTNIERLDITGGSGSDSFTGGAYSDTFNGSAGNDTLDGGAGDDLLKGGAGDDALTGGLGWDVADYSDASGGVIVALYKQAWVAKNQTPGAAGSDILTGIEELRGGAFGDYLLGASGADVLRGGGGHDELESFAGNDSLYGESGDDLIFAGDGRDVLVGDGGNDFLSGQSGDDFLYGGDGLDILTGGAGGDFLSGGSGKDHLFGGAGADTIYTGDGERELAFGDDGDDLIIADGTGWAELQGGEGADSLRSTGAKRIEAFGEGGDDFLFGGDFDDYLSAGVGDDVVYGNGGNDRLIGGAGADSLHGGAGDDYLWGGAGADKFYIISGFSSGQLDTIKDFEDGLDQIYLATNDQSSVRISLSTYGSYITFNTPEGQASIIVEDVSPTVLAINTDIIFV